MHTTHVTTSHKRSVARRHRPQVTMTKPVRVGLLVTPVRHDLQAILDRNPDALAITVERICEDLAEGRLVEVLWVRPGHPALPATRAESTLRELLTTMAHAPRGADLRIAASSAGLDPAPFVEVVHLLAKLGRNNTNRPDRLPVAIMLPLHGEEAGLRNRHSHCLPTTLVQVARRLHLAGWPVQLVPGATSRFPGWREDWEDAVALVSEVLPDLASSLRHA